MKKFLLSLAGLALTVSAYADSKVYFSEDFEWLAPWALVGNGEACGSTVETDNPDANAPQLSTPKVEEVSAYDALLGKGYQILATHAESKSERTPEKQTYLQTNYLKFGLTGYYSGIVMPINEDIPEGEALTLSFDWCSQRQGSGKWDATEIVVIVNTDGTDVSYPVEAWSFPQDALYEWVNEKIEIKAGGLKKGSTITIRNADSQWPNEKGSANRWFLDNVQVYSDASSAVDAVEAAENVPVEYFNLQGVRVNNPSNGVYIVKQGDKIEKRIIR